MAIWTLAKKELRLLLRDPRSVVILLAAPLIFILILGLALGEGFGQKPDDRLRVSLVDLDRGYTDPVLGARQAAAWWLAAAPAPGAPSGQLPGTLALAAAVESRRFPRETWARVVRRDLEETASIRVEVIDSYDAALDLVRRGKRSAVLVFHPQFSERVAHCSFLAAGWAEFLIFLSCWPQPGMPANLTLAALVKGWPGHEPPQIDGINPFYRDGVQFSEVAVQLLRDDTQVAAASIIEQVAQVALLRVILPWMIGKAFERLGEIAFIDRMAEEIYLPVLGSKMPLKDLLRLPEHKQAVGTGVQGALRKQFPKYELTGKTWAALTKAEAKHGGVAAAAQSEVRYQILVPSYTVMFAFFLVLTMGWLFVSERRQGTLKRLRAAPVSRAEVLLGKLTPCLALSLAQGAFLLLAGKLVFGMRWGPADWPLWKQVVWLLPVVGTTSLAAMGLALLVAALARTEAQVAIYGTLLVLILAGVSGCLMPRDLMPEQMKELSLVTPHAWALDAYAQLLLSAHPNLVIVGQACLALTLFGVAFASVAWWVLRLD